MGKPDEVLEMPLYLQISRKLANEIESGLYTSGQKIPSIRSFAREYGVSNSTVQIAYQHLVDRGYVAPTHGKGFVVCDFDHVAIPPITGTSPKMQAELEAMVRAENDEKNKAIVDYDFSFTNADKTLFPFLLLGTHGT